MALWSLFTNLKLGIEGYIVAISGSKAVRDGFAEPIYSGFKRTVDAGPVDIPAYGIIQGNRGRNEIGDKTTDGFHIHPLAILILFNMVIVTVHQ